MTNRRNGEPWLASAASWAVLVASFGLSAATWIDLGVLAGFTAHTTIGGLTMHLAWLLPVSVDGYVVVGLVLWMSDVPEKVARFAKRNTYLAAGIGIAAQSAYHLLFTLSETDQSWRVVLAAIVGALPPALAAGAVHMRALIRRESQHANNSHHIATPNPVVAAVAMPIYQPQPMTPAAAQLPTTTPAPSPVLELPIPPMPTPAEVAPRISPPAPSPGRPETAPARTAPVPRTRPAARVASRAPLAPPATDSSVTAPGAAQPLPTLIDPVQLAQARRIVAQYLTENGRPIRAAQLAVAMKVPSDQAARYLTAIDADPTSSTPTVNGRALGANR